MRGDLPNGPGFFYRKNAGGTFDWECMLTKANWSFESISWLNHLQRQPPFTVGDQIYQIQHALNRGEKMITVDGRKYYVDGYAVVGDTTFLFEFDGCQYHSCSCDTSTRSPFTKKDDRQRDKDLASVGVLIKKKECEWLAEKPKTTTNLVSQFFRRKNITEEEIISAVQNGSFFGLLCVDLHSPPEVVDYFMQLKFPPIYKHVKVQEDMMSPKIRDDMIKAGMKFPLEKQLTLGFHAQEYLLTSDLAQFYLKKGIKMTNLRLAVEYYRDKPLAKFVNLVTEKRKEATRIKDDHLQNTYKLVMNSSYGKLGLNKTQFKNYKYVKPDGNKMIDDPFVAHVLPVTGEFETDFYEIASRKRSYKDSVPGEFILLIIQICLL